MLSSNVPSISTATSFTSFFTMIYSPYYRFPQCKHCYYINNCGDFQYIFSSFPPVSLCREGFSVCPARYAAACHYFSAARTCSRNFSTGIMPRFCLSSAASRLLTETMFSSSSLAPTMSIYGTFSRRASRIL